MMGLAVAGGGGGFNMAPILGLGGDLDRRSWQWEAPTLPSSTEKEGVHRPLYQYRSMLTKYSSRAGSACLGDRLTAPS